MNRTLEAENMPEIPYEVSLKWLQEWIDGSARSILARLDRSLAPSTFFVGIFPNFLLGELVNSSEAIRKNVRLFGSEISQTIIEAFGYFRNELAQAEREIALLEDPPLTIPINGYEYPAQKGAAIGVAIAESLNQTRDGENKIYFSGRAVWRQIDRHFVCPVLSLDRKHYEKQYALKKAITLNKTSTSLLNLVINQFLQACVLGLKEDNADIDPFVKASRNVLVDSARTMMLFWNLTETVNLNTANFHLFDDCNSIAALAYEKRESLGQLIVASQGHPNICVKVRFTKPIPIKNYRLARKLLEMAQDGSSLLCNLNELYGLGNVWQEQYDLSREDLFRVEFTGQNSWRLFHGNNEMMMVDLGQPKLPAKLISEAEFEAKFRKQFNDSGDAKTIYNLVEAAAKQTHGALIIISDRALPEANRFAGQCLQVDPFPATERDILQLTAIDGAVLIDSEGQCYALGVILDGESMGDGEPSRGSRYNSAFRYVSTMRKKEHKCIAAVVSADGTVDLL